jgi:thiol:disulfide interchange protein DsbG
MGSQAQRLTAEQVAQVPALQRIASADASLLDFGTMHGMRTIFARKDNAFEVFYLMPDGSAAIGGIMWDSNGHDITRDQVAPIPGVIPTVKIGPGGAQPKAAAAVDQSDNVDALKLGSDTTYAAIGPANARHMWMFIDPFCGFSVRAMQQLEPYIQSGKLQLSVIPLSVFDFENQGRSTPAAKIMGSEPSSQMVADWVNGSLTGSSPSNVSDLLSKNMAIASALHLRGTPTMIWLNTDGSTGRADGIPPDLNSVLSSIRS